MTRPDTAQHSTAQVIPRDNPRAWSHPGLSIYWKFPNVCGQEQTNKEEHAPGLVLLSTRQRPMHPWRRGGGMLSRRAPQSLGLSHHVTQYRTEHHGILSVVPVSTAKAAPRAEDVYGHKPSVGATGGQCSITNNEQHEQQKTTRHLTGRACLCVSLGLAALTEGFCDTNETFGVYSPLANSHKSNQTQTQPHTRTHAATHTQLHIHTATSTHLQMEPPRVAQGSRRSAC